LIEFETQVIDVQKEKDEEKQNWSVVTQDLKSKSTRTRHYDAIVIASGHYNTPFIPEIKGIQAWSQKFPGVITHSKFFRRPEDFKDKVYRDLLAHLLTLTCSRKYL